MWAAEKVTGGQRWDVLLFRWVFVVSVSQFSFSSKGGILSQPNLSKALPISALLAHTHTPLRQWFATSRSPSRLVGVYFPEVSLRPSPMRSSLKYPWPRDSAAAPSHPGRRSGWPGLAEWLEECDRKDLAGEQKHEQQSASCINAKHFRSQAGVKQSAVKIINLLFTSCTKNIKVIAHPAWAPTKQLRTLPLISWRCGVKTSGRLRHDPKHQRRSHLPPPPAVPWSAHFLPRWWPGKHKSPSPRGEHPWWSALRSWKRSSGLTVMVADQETAASRHMYTTKMVEIGLLCREYKQDESKQNTERNTTLIRNTMLGLWESLKWFLTFALFFGTVIFSESCQVNKRLLLTKLIKKVKMQTNCNVCYYK